MIYLHMDLIKTKVKLFTKDLSVTELFTLYYLWYWKSWTVCM